ncbi:nitrilase-related carbon-nitrogen hydrolase [Streptomyces sp. M19]
MSPRPTSRRSTRRRARRRLRRRSARRPELYLTGYALDDAVHRLAEPADGPGAAAVARVAAAHGLTVLYGYPERAGDAVYNAAQLIAPTAPGSPTTARRISTDRTSAAGSPGRDPVVQARLGGLTVGVLICYDVEFPENVRAHALAGTDLLLVPTAQTRPFAFVAERLVPVRAFESQLYVAYVNRTGPEGAFDFVGLSCLAGPDGAVVARAGSGEELILGEADPERLRASRAANPYLRDRRPELYA